MSYRDPNGEPPGSVLPYITAFALIALVLLIAWYLFWRNEHSLELLPYPARAHGAATIRFSGQASAFHPKPGHFHPSPGHEFRYEARINTRSHILPYVIIHFTGHGYFIVTGDPAPTCTEDDPVTPLNGTQPGSLETPRGEWAVGYHFEGLCTVDFNLLPMRKGSATFTFDLYSRLRSPDRFDPRSLTGHLTWHGVVRS